ncbi:MAG: hypothetical protein JW779_06235 [Candidatus Thorarchaeota archaeon]|nr:hypothetical protein [Candidatus Thorarchaeota archaeon]
MRTEHPAKAYRKLVDEFDIDFRLTDKQSVALDNNDEVIISNEQLENIIDQLIVIGGIDDFLKKNVNALLPVSVSLFVVNDRLWKMMERKIWEPEKMLAMSTIPLCTWDQSSEKISNPKGIKRWEVQPNNVVVSFDDCVRLMIEGEGGDFSGFIEQSQLTMRKWGLPDTRRLIPNYAFESLYIDVLLNRAELITHPEPIGNLDYDFSDQARVFYEHGFLVRLPGEDVTLKVGKRKPTKMLGDVYLLVGSRVTPNDEPYLGLLVDIWLGVLERKMKG